MMLQEVKCMAQKVYSLQNWTSELSKKIIKCTHKKSYLIKKNFLPKETHISASNMHKVYIIVFYALQF